MYYVTITLREDSPKKINALLEFLVKNEINYSYKNSTPPPVGSPPAKDTFDL